MTRRARVLLELAVVYDDSVIAAEAAAERLAADAAEGDLDFAWPRIEVAGARVSSVRLCGGEPEGDCGLFEGPG